MIISPNQKTSSRRLFFALWPNETVRQMLAEIAGNIASHGGRSVPRQNFHVTLAFLGAVEPERRGCVETIAADISANMGANMGAQHFRLRLDRVGSFPRAGIIWSGASKTPSALLSLVRRLNSGLADCGLTLEKRPFKTHVTLFRKAGRVEDASHALVEWPVSDFCLVESSTLPGGARYRVLRRWPLR
uniref:RNA 2',3'-cyclic phosphodiesterase n=1 Tax=Candidatus Kentrum sp. MB TaxID=2138164 RepID=A0A450XJL3_9GAMM|nr:MAG: 2'-5' RNA ligase [Candidatus Kentron sp. MB]VFK74785.1 MAG: 2'-5' RNA ligase [Candidatus Kentron sp. MB]